MFKAVIDDIMRFIHLLFNDIYDCSIFPEDWCKNIISAIHKNGPENCSAIALINCFCKLFINILTIRLPTGQKHIML